MTTRGRIDPHKTPLSDAELLSAITQDLRAIYADIIRRPLPDELAAALRRLEAATKDDPGRALPAEAGFRRRVGAAG